MKVNQRLLVSGSTGIFNLTISPNVSKVALSFSSSTTSGMAAILFFDY